MFNILSRPRVIDAGLRPANTDKLRPSQQVPEARPAEAVTWGTSAVAGRGLFAERRFEAGELISRSPAVAVRYADLDPALAPYGFRVNRAAVDPGCADELMPYAIVFGPASVCNHADKPNASVTFRRSSECGFEAELIATHAIAAGDEIFICYPDFRIYQKRGLF